jgi:hypothetical protein
MRGCLASIASVLLAMAAFGATPAYESMSLWAQHDAAVFIDGRVQPIFFEGTEIAVTVQLQSWTGDSAHAYPGDWPRHVNLVLSRDDGTGARVPVAKVVRQDPEEVHVGERVAIDHSVLAQFLLDPLPKGRYKLTASYGSLSRTTNGTMFVVHGDETPEIRDWALQRQLEKATTWEETKRLQLKRIENNPRNAGAWFALAAGSEQFEDYQTTKAYYEKAMSISREIGGPQADETVRGVERILELLPAYYADREHLVIVRENLGGPGTPTVVELRERKALPPRANEKQR